MQALLGWFPARLDPDALAAHLKQAGAAAARPTPKFTLCSHSNAGWIITASGYSPPQVPRELTLTQLRLHPQIGTLCPPPPPPLPPLLAGQRLDATKVADVKLRGDAQMLYTAYLSASLLEVGCLLSLSCTQRRAGPLRVSASALHANVPAECWSAGGITRPCAPAPLPPCTQPAPVLHNPRAGGAGGLPAPRRGRAALPPPGGL